VIAIGAAAITVLAFSPVLTTTYGFLDDYSLLYSAQIHAPGTWDLFLLGGRPVAGFIEWAAFSVVHTVDQLLLMRAFNVACLALVALGSVLALRRLRYTVLAAWTFAVGMLWLPSTQVMASWATMIHGPAALVLALLAAASMSNALEKPLHAGGRSVREVMPFLPAVALLSTAVCTYQPTAMAYWPIAVLFLLAPARRSWSPRTLVAGAAIAGGIGLVACGVGYAIFKIGVRWVGGQPLARSGSVDDIGAKLDYLLHVAAPRAFDPWQLTIHPRLATAVAVALVVLVPLAIGGDLKRRLLGLALVALSLPLSYLPSIATAENWASARSLAGAYVVPLAALTLVVQGLPHLRRFDVPLRIAAMTAVGVIAFGAGYTRVSDYFTEPGHDELVMARDTIRPELARVHSPVVVVASDWRDSLAPSVSFDEFGIPSSYGSWVPVPLTQILARESTGRSLADVRLVERSGLRSVPPTSIVIDYGHLLDEPQNAVVYRGGAHAQ